MASLLKMLTPVTVRAARAGRKMGARMEARGKGPEAAFVRAMKMGKKMRQLPGARRARRIRYGIGLAGLGGYVGYKYKKKASLA